MYDSISFFNKPYTVCRAGEIIRFEINKNNQASIQIFQNEIITDELGNKYIVTQVSPSPPFSLFPYILALKPDISSPAQYSIENINNSNIIINSPSTKIDQEISKLPPEAQLIAKELSSVLIEFLQTKIKPKKFTQRFGDFIAKYSNAIASLGSLALQTLPLLMGMN